MTAKDALFTGILDYAGLFPPASLSLSEALRLWAQYLRHPKGWILGRFVLSAEHAGEAALLVNPPQRITLLVNGPGVPSLWREVEIVESKCLLEKDPGVPCFVEINWRHEIEPAMDQAAQRSRTGVKLRTGGVTAETVPSVPAVVNFLVEAARRKLPVKFTAGLHQPVPHDDPKAGARMHGFLNIFGAAFAAYEHRAKPEELETILRDYGYEHFKISDKEFRCGKRSYSTAAIAQLRKEFVVSFGSCSFDEPVDHLTRHGLL